jgi:hypothetical protein
LNNGSNKEIENLSMKLFSSEEQEKIQEIYEKICSDEDFDLWRNKLDDFDESIGGIGSKRLIIKEDGGYTGEYPHDPDGERGITYRSLQYVLMYFFATRNPLTRVGILYSCLHIEGILKNKFKMKKTPLGGIVDMIKRKKYLSLTIIDLLDRMTIIWNDVKHELDLEPLVIHIKNRKVVKESKHRYTDLEVIKLYFVSRKIGIMLLKEEQ